MIRSLYSSLVCLMLGLLAAMWLRPGVAQELIELANRFRAQSPEAPPGWTGDPNRYPNWTPPQTEEQYQGAGQAPLQPRPASTPAGWPNSPSAPSPTAPAPAASYPSASDPSYAAHGSSSGSGPSFDAANASLVRNPSPQFSGDNLQVLPSRPQELTDAQIVARVGSEVILASDINAAIADYLFAQKIRVPPGQEAQAHQTLFRPLLRQAIETKLVYNDAIHSLPKENLPKIETGMNEAFDQQQLPKLFEMHQVSNKHALDAKLREQGSSLERVRRSFFEKSLAQAWVQEHMKNDEEIPISDVLGDYHANIKDYQYPARVRWEELMVRFDRFPNREAAWAALAEMGNAVRNGAPFAEVAKARSQGVTASDGGVYDWTSKGSLRAKQIDHALFSLPVGALSRPIETENGFHIVRPIERTQAGCTPFVDAQADIKKRLKEEKAKRQIEAFLSNIRKRTPVWTIYDNQPGGLEGPEKS